MPLYLYENKETGEVVEVLQGMNELHQYNGIDNREKGLWRRVYVNPALSFDTKVDAFDSKSFVSSTVNKNDTYGDLFERSAEARKAVLIAEMTEDFMKEEKKITSTFDNDPLLKLKSREVDLRAMENQRKKDYDDERINIDKAKLVQDRDLTEDKLEQNEELAELRADTSLTKQAMSQAGKIQNDMMKMADVKILKGPKR